MALPVILDEIRASGDAQLREIEKGAQAQVDEILACAEAQARQIEEQARAAANAPAVAERARIIYTARLEALKIVGKVREELVDTAFARAYERLASIHTHVGYPEILRSLVDEALAELAPDEKARLFANPRDKLLLDAILVDLKMNLPVSYNLDCLGGLVVESEDSRIVIINTLEARLERATPFLRNHLAASFEDGKLL